MAHGHIHAQLELSAAVTGSDCCIRLTLELESSSNVGNNFLCLMNIFSLEEGWDKSECRGLRLL